MSNELVKIDPNQQVQQFAAFGNSEDFASIQRMAKCLSSSTIVPVAFQGEQNIGNCVIALEMSQRMGASPLAIMQSIYIVHGKPGWSSTFLIACLNASQRFTPMRFKMTGEKGKDTWGCIAHCTDKNSGEDLDGPEVTIEMAKKEGWYGKTGSKWPNMPELMLRYRAATFFVRLYSPETTMGIQTADELGDAIDVQATVTSPAPVSPSFKKSAENKGVTVEAEVTTSSTSPAVTPPTTPPTPAAKRKQTPKPHDTAHQVAKPVETAAEPVASTQPAETEVAATEPESPEADPFAPEPAAAAAVHTNDSPEVADLRVAMAEAKLSDDKVMAFVIKKGALKEGTDKELAILSDIIPTKVGPLAKLIRSRGAAYKEMAA